MALESFYGGKPGFSPVIKGKFKYLNKDDLAYQADLVKQNESAETLKPYTMDECFADPNYTDIWYDELCIIDTDNKSNPNNGKIFRRTLKKVDDDAWLRAGNTLYAEYIGKIVGPAGGIPKLHLGGLDEERKRAAGILGTYEGEDPDSGQTLGENWLYTYPNSEGKIASLNPNKASNGYNVIAELSASTNSDTNRIEMVPGKDTKNNTVVYNDTIKYTWCNVRRSLDASDEDCWIYLGFQIPYTVFDINVVSESSNYRGPVFEDNSNAEHPFAKDFTFHIPRGVRGIGPEEVFVVNPYDPDNSRTVPDGATLYTYDAIKYTQNTDTYSIDTTKTKTVTSKDSYWVGKWRIYNADETNGSIYYLYLGAYKDASSLTTGNADIHIIGEKSGGYTPGIDDHDHSVSQYIEGNNPYPYGVKYINDKEDNAELFFIDTRKITEVNNNDTSITIVKPGGYQSLTDILGSNLLTVIQR